MMLPQPPRSFNFVLELLAGGDTLLHRLVCTREDEYRVRWCVLCRTLQEYSGLLNCIQARC